MAASCGPSSRLGARPDRSRVRRGGGETAVLGLLCGPARGRLALGKLRLLPDAEHAFKFSVHARRRLDSLRRRAARPRGLSVFAGLDLSETIDGPH